jgi:UrcA family protein
VWSEVEVKFLKLEQEMNMNSYAMTDSRIFPFVGSLMLAVSVLLLTHNASAANTDDEVSMAVVKFQDLDVNTPAGAASLYWRIHRAANQVCGLDEHSIPRLFARVECAQDAEARAIGQLNLSRLTAYYQAQTGKLPTPRVSMAK